jgi:hypothetical protein
MNTLRGTATTAERVSRAASTGYRVGFVARRFRGPERPGWDTEVGDGHAGAVCGSGAVGWGSAGACRWLAPMARKGNFKTSLATQDPTRNLATGGV